LLLQPYAQVARSALDRGLVERRPADDDLQLAERATFTKARQRSRRDVAVARSAKSCKTASLVWESRLPVGSSATISGNADFFYT